MRFLNKILTDPEMKFVYLYVNVYVYTGCHVLELLSISMVSFFEATLPLVDLLKLSLNFTIFPVYF